jgi:hypothetical protein
MPPRAGVSLSFVNKELLPFMAFFGPLSAARHCFAIVAIAFVVL